MAYKATFSSEIAAARRQVVLARGRKIPVCFASRHVSLGPPAIPLDASLCRLGTKPHLNKRTKDVNCFRTFVIPCPMHLVPSEPEKTRSSLGRKKTDFSFGL